MVSLSSASRQPRAAVAADTLPAALLRSARVVGPDGECLGTIRLVIRHQNGSRSAVVHRRWPSRRAIVVSLRDAVAIADGPVVVRSGADLRLLPTPPV